MRFKNHILAVLFLLLIFGSLYTAEGYKYAWQTLTGIYASVFTKDTNDEEQQSEDMEASEEASDIEASDNENKDGWVTAVLQGIKGNIQSLEDNLLNTLPYKNNMIELNGRLLKTTGTRSYYNLSEKINITTNDYYVRQIPQTSTDYEVEQMIDFKKFLDEKDIQLLYVNEPSKYIDDQYYIDQFGEMTYLNYNADLFLSRIADAGIEYIDLRDNIREEKLDPMSLFYRTDHHWTVPASLWAANIIAERLNQDYGYNINLTLYNPENLKQVNYENCWLGEQGRMVSSAYIGLDSFTMIEPLYETSFSILKKDGTILNEGDFDIFINNSTFPADISKQLLYICGLGVHPIGHFTFYAGCDIC